jgi:multiple sugar transport system permease protein
MLISSIQPSGVIYASRPQLVFEPTLQNYLNLFTGGSTIVQNLINSVIVSSISAAIAVVLGVLGGYGLSRLEIAGKKHLAFWIISTRMAPIAVAIIPLFFLYANLGLINTYLGLIIAYSTFNVPFAIWLMRSFFDEVPRSLEEAALVDGATRWQSFRKVVLPLVKPGIGATAIIAIVFSWNDFLFALLFTNAQTQTVPVVAASLVTQAGTQWGRVMATGVIILAPMVGFGIIVRDYLVEGLTMGAVKQ